jgi:signal transduction histidine kinase
LRSKTLLGSFAVAAVALAVAIGFFERASPDYASHRDFMLLLEERRDLDQELAQHALEARFDLTSNYDQLATDEVDMRRLDAEARARIPGFLGRAERQEVVEALARYAARSAERQVLVDRFKSTNAVFKNSIASFPTLTSAVLRGTADQGLIAAVAKLRGQTFGLALRDDAGASIAQERSLEEVLALMSGETGTERRDLDLMLVHARVIASEKAHTDALLRQILDLTIDRAREEVSARYQSYYVKARRKADVFGTFVSGLALVLLLVVAYAVLRLRRLASALQRLNQGLEAAVLKRTAELEEAMARRERLEIELRHAQKLESVGQLASGIAHEINTPIQYVGDSVYFLGDAFKDLLLVMDGYHQALALTASSGAPLPAFSAVQQLEQELGIESLKADIPEAIARTLDGAKQVTHIVSAMKTFAHTSVEKLPFDLNAGIENTLTVARNEYKYIADLETEYAEIPSVICNASGVRQVFLNLIVNAAHAIADVVGETGARGVIRIRTASRGESVVVSVSDTGTGIPEAVRARIFDPFFTTKPPGKGSGQGLAISQSIVDQHGGKLWFETEMTRGTTFFLELPVEAKVRTNPLSCDQAA